MKHKMTSVQTAIVAGAITGAAGVGLWHALIPAIVGGAVGACVAGAAWLLFALLKHLTKDWI